MALLYNCNAATLSVVSVIKNTYKRGYDLHTGGSLTAIVYARIFCALQREIRSNQLHENAIMMWHLLWSVPNRQNVFPHLESKICRSMHLCSTIILFVLLLLVSWIFAMFWFCAAPSYLFARHYCKTTISSQIMPDSLNTCTGFFERHIKGN